MELIKMRTTSASVVLCCVCLILAGIVSGCGSNGTADQNASNAVSPQKRGAQAQSDEANMEAAARARREKGTTAPANP